MNNEEAIANLNQIYGVVSADIQRSLDVAFKYMKGRPQGKWIDTGSGQECNVCHEIQYGYDNFRYYCPHCGANMRGDKND